MPFSLAFFTTSKESSEAEREIARVIPVIWNQLTPLNTLSQSKAPVAFTQLFTFEEGRSGVVVSFIAMLELIKEGLIACLQVEPDSQIYVSLNESAAS